MHEATRAEFVHQIEEASEAGAAGLFSLRQAATFTRN